MTERARPGHKGGYYVYATPKEAVFCRYTLYLSSLKLTIIFVPLK